MRAPPKKVFSDISDWKLDSGDSALVETVVETSSRAQYALVKILSENN